MSNSSRVILGLALLFAPMLGCDDDPPPVPQAAPEEFDDPFAEEAEPAEEAEEAEPIADGESAQPALLAAADAPPVGEPEPEPEPDPAADPPPAEASEIATDQEQGSAEEQGSAKARDSELAKTPTKSRTKDKASIPETPPPSKPAPEPAAAVEPPVDEAPPPEPEPPAKATPVAAAAVDRDHEPPPLPGARLTGSYRYVGGAAQRQRLEDAIDLAVQQLSALIRGIGRRRLTESNQIRDAVKLTIQGDKVTTTFTPGGTVTTTLGAPAISWTTDTGKSVKVKSSLVKGRLVQDYQADDGSRRNVFTVDASGDKLTLSVTIRSDRLKEPLKYALSYRRK